ncbi:MAG: hypothetical protein LBM67_06190 [Lentimicrobiaceae bacterium]|nr:hypothetical protein [Lentimicrobiaceae bacterium]
MQQPKKPKRKELSIFLFFVLFSSLMWLLIKLSDQYNITTEIKVNFENIPAEKFMPLPHEYTLKTTVTSTGFNLLRFYTTRKVKRTITIALDQTPYRQAETNLYYIGTQQVRDKVADLMHVSINAVLFPENEIYFTLETLKSKIVPVSIKYDFRYRKQYGIYGEPNWEPKEIEIFGSENVIDTLQFIYTKKIEKDDLYENFETDVLLDFRNDLQSETKSVRLSVEVERFTESSVTVPIEQVTQQKLRLFPDHVTINYNVAMRDFRRIDSKLFQVRVAMSDLQSLEPFLKLEVTPPANVHLIRYEPEQVEYLILQ